MDFIVLVLSLLMVAWGADILINGSVKIASALKMSDFVIGALIVGIGTSLPEYAVSTIGTLNGHPDIAIGNIVGSNIFNVLVVLGITSIILPLTIEKCNIKFDLPFCIGISILLILLNFVFSVGTLAKIEGIILLCIMAWYIVKSFKNSSETTEVSDMPIWKAILSIIIGLIVLVVCSKLFVNSAINIARFFNISEAFISLTIVASGTSLPELVSSIVAAIKKKPSMAVGNIIGSNIFNILFILGSCAFISPLSNSNIVLVDYLVMLLAIVLLWLIGFKGIIKRWHGILLLSVYIIYTIYLTNQQFL